MNKTIVTLSCARDTYNFRVGDPVECVMGSTGHVWRAGRVETLMIRARRLASRLTRWWRPRTVVTNTNADTGTITLETQRWSWTKWRWM